MRIFVLLPLLVVLSGCSKEPILKYEIKGNTVTITDCDESASGKLVIPAKIEGNPVTSIGDGAFSWCWRLTTIEVGEGNVNFTEVNGVLFNAEKTVLLTYPAGKKGANYTIPDGVTSIGISAFTNSQFLRSITIPDSVTSIGYAAFRYCTNLNSITIPEGVTSIGNWAFDDCYALRTVTIPDSVTSIGDGAFDECNRLNSITIGNGVTSIGDWAFYCCNDLNSITIPDSVTSIGGSALSNCSNLTSIKIPDSVASIGASAFSDCSKLNAVTFLGDAPEFNRNWEPFDKNTNIYRKPEAKGWGDTWAGRPVKLISEKP